MSEALFNKALRAFNNGRLARAEELCRRLLCENPNHGDALNLLGLLAQQNGEHERAISLLEHARTVNPDSVSSYTNLGLVHCQQGRFDEALPYFEQALSMAPDKAENENNVGLTLKELGVLDEAEKHLRRAVELRADYAEANNNLALLLTERGRYNEACLYARRALMIKPGYLKAQQNLRMIYQAQVPLWHFPMMGDDVRNTAFDSAIRKRVTPDALVLDIGTGAGLLAMMAARAGARKVVSCEMVPLIAEKAREIVAKNGYAGCIDVIAKKSTFLRVGDELPQKADLLITETFDAGLLGEGALESIDDARLRLLREDAAVIPKGATVFGMLVESESLLQKGHVSQAAGFDLGAFNEFRPHAFQQQLSVLPSVVRLSESFEALRFDFTGTANTGNPAEIQVPVLTSGTCHGVAFWYRLHLDDEISIHTGPDQSHSHWKQMVQLFVPPEKITSGETVKVIASHDRLSIDFRLRK